MGTTIMQSTGALSGKGALVNKKHIQIKAALSGWRARNVMFNHELLVIIGGGDGAVMTALAPDQGGPGSIP